MSDPINDEVESRLNSADQRYTRVRKEIVRALCSGSGPLTTSQILDASEGLALSSVYRNLSILEEVGAVSRLVSHDEFARYEVAEDLIGHHHHLICVACGEVSDFSLDSDLEGELERALAKIAHRDQFKETGHRLDLIGRCKDCGVGITLPKHSGLRVARPA